MKYSRVVAATLDANGKLVDVASVSPNPGPFDASALATVRNCVRARECFIELPFQQS